VWRLAVVAVVMTGCFSPVAPSGRPCSATGECPEAQVCSPQNTCETSSIDAPPGDSRLRDAPTDGLGDGPLQIDAAAPRLVAHYSLDGTLADVSDEAHDGSVIGDGTSYVSGVMGQALHLPHAANAHIRVEDSPDFDLASGRIELRFRFAANAPVGDLGLLSRDASGSMTGGHFNLRIGHDRRVVLRIQRQSDPTIEAYRCSQQPVSAGAWHHVDATFGPSGLVLRVDGVVTAGTTWTSAQADSFSCTTAWTGGIDGNNNPLVIGALTVISDENLGTPNAIAGDVDLDEVKIWEQP
jgi:hypothetical protein